MLFCGDRLSLPLFIALLMLFCAESLSSGLFFAFANAVLIGNVFAGKVLVFFARKSLCCMTINSLSSCFACFQHPGHHSKLTGCFGSVLPSKYWPTCAMAKYGVSTIACNRPFKHRMMFVVSNGQHGVLPYSICFSCTGMKKQCTQA